jgi:putative chitinase
VRELNALADRDDFDAITRKINGGLNGLVDRLELWGRARAVLCVSST